MPPLDLAGWVNQIGFRHPVNAPRHASTAIIITPNRNKRVAILLQKLQRVLWSVFIGNANGTDLVGQMFECGGLGAAGGAP